MFAFNSAPRRDRLPAWNSDSAVVTLGVHDLARARAFYEALGWSTRAAPADDVVFFQAGGLVVSLWDREALAADSGVDDTGGWGGITLAHNVRSPAEVDAVVAEAEAAGASVTRRPGRRSGAATRAPSPIRTATRGKSRTTRGGRSTTTAPCASRPERQRAASRRPSSKRWRVEPV